MPKRIAVIADDLTGANTVGARFAKQGLSALVVLGDLAPGGTVADVLVVDTQSRALDPAQAYDHAALAAGMFRGLGVAHVYKQVDAGLRGNPGAEIEAVLDVLGLDLALVAPASPREGRTVVGGYLLVDGAPLETTQAALDPECPARQSHLPTLLASQTKRGVGWVGLADVHVGEEAVAKALGRCLAEGRAVVACDTWEEAQFPVLARAALSLGGSVLWVGSLGLAECLPQVLEFGPAKAARHPVVVVAGSVSGVTRTQAASLRKRPGVVSVAVDAAALVDPADRPAEIRRVFDVAGAAARAGRDVLVHSAGSDGAVEKAKEKALSLGMDGSRAAGEVARGLGEICRLLATGLDIAGLVLDGADTAVAACQALQAAGVVAHSEVAPGMLLAELCGGAADGLKVVTKAGAFGAEDALCLAVDALKR